MKLHFAIFLASAASAGAFTVPYQQCSAPPQSSTRIFYKNEESPSIPDVRTPSSSGLSEIVKTPSRGDVESVEEEVLTERDVSQIRSLVKNLSSVEMQTLRNIVINNRDLDVEAHDKVVTPKRTRKFQPLADSIAKTLLDTQSDTIIAQKETESIFKKLVELFDEADQLFLGAGEKLEYEKYPNHPEFQDFNLSNMMPMLKGVPPLEYWFSPRKFRRLIKRILLTTVGLSLTAGRVEKAQAEKKFKAFFTEPKVLGVLPNPLDLLPQPEYTIDHWEDDREFARQFLNGVNPLMIERVQDLQKQVTSELKTFLTGQIDLELLTNEKRLFVVDYKWLADLKVHPHQAFPKPMNPDSPQDQPRYFQSPQVVLMLDALRQNLEVLAVQLEQEAGSKVYSRATTDDPTWFFVKTSVASCDSQFHEWVSHLGKTHLTMEPHIVAIHNTLRKKKHPLFTFIKPMVQDTLLLGFAARRTLASYGKDSFGDRMTSVGTGQFMQLIDRYWSNYDFFKSSALLDELASRGFDEDLDMPTYLYRKDGMKLWDAYGEFASDFVDEIYQNDRAIADDAVLQEWAKESSSTERAAVKGFPERFEDKATLVKTLQTIWWICSGLHAAVNFPQYEYYSFTPNKPLNMRKGTKHYEESRKDNPSSRDWIFSHALPNMDAAKEAITVSRALTLPSKHTIDKLEDNFQGLGRDAYHKFLSRLDNIGNEINARNKKNRGAGKPVYHYLHPSVVPASIDI